MNIEKSETDSKWRNLKKTYSRVGLRKNILLWNKNKSKSKNHHYSPALVSTMFMYTSKKPLNHTSTLHKICFLFKLDSFNCIVFIGKKVKKQGDGSII